MLASSCFSWEVAEVSVDTKRDGSLAATSFGVSIVLQGALLFGNVCCRMIRCLFCNS